MKTLLIDAIVGVGFPAVTLALECEKVGMARFTGNQYNPSWEWNRLALYKCSEEQLQELYQGVREERESQNTPKPMDEASIDLIVTP